LPQSDGPGHNQTLAAGASDGAAGITHAERSADQPAGRTAGPWMRRPPPHAQMAHNAQPATHDGNKCARTKYCYDKKITNKIITKIIK